MQMPGSSFHSEDLATRLLDLDSAAYREFAQVFEKRFTAFFRRRGMGVSDAEDLAATCITDIALKVGKCRSLNQKSFDAWVFVLASHALSDWWRHHRTTFIPIDDLTNSILPTKSRPNASLVQVVRRALAKLSENDQLLIQLRHLQGEQTYQEIGKQLGITAGAARVRHFRALNRLELLIEADINVGELLRCRTAKQWS